MSRTARHPLQAEVDEMTNEVAALDEQIARAQAEAHALANHPDPEVRVTHDVRARRTQVTAMGLVCGVGP